MRVVVCGVKSRMLDFFLELLRQNPGLEPRLVSWVGPDSRNAWVQQVISDERFKSIHWVEGEPFEEQTLSRAGIRDADRALVLVDSSDRSSSIDEADTRTVMTVLSIKKLRPELHVLAEVVDPDFLPFLEMAQVDEVLWVRETNRMLLAQVSVATGIAEVFRALCGAESDGAGRLDAIDIPASLAGRSFGELRSGLESRAVGICIGYVQNPGNRRTQKWAALEDAQKSPEVRNVLRNLGEVLKRKFNHPILLPSEDASVPEGARALVLRAANQASGEVNS
jgi:hypothetical protein